MKKYFVTYKYYVSEAQTILANSKREAIFLAKKFEGEMTEPQYSGEGLKCFKAEVSE